ncbi:MAG: glycosyltransferase family 39 protein [Candidatus Margulisbacteria bacterium]|nr:glycosyltransferase family 39 protein [Candidatus Margulisiibacteriota bacterium]
MNLPLFLIVAINLLKLGLIRFFPLIGDEAYYWLWGQHLAFSYVDHPPMIAYLNRVLATLFGNSELAVRLAALTIVALVTYIIYLTAKELFGKQTALWSALFFNLIPTFFGGGMFLVPQMLVFFFWSLSCYLLIRLIKSGDGKYWYYLGISIGLGLLSDYVMALFIFATFMYLIVDQEKRFWFWRKEPYLGLCLSLGLFLPVIVWNFGLGFTPLFYWGGKMGAGPRIGDNLLNFFGLQTLLYTPPIFLGTIYLIFKQFWKPKTNREVYSQVFLMATFAGAVFLPFALISPIINVGGHWPACAYLPAIVASGKMKRWTIVVLLIFALILDGAGLSYYLFAYPTPADLKGKEFSINAQLPAYIKETTPKSGKTYYFANDLGMLGLVAFHGQVKVNMAPGRLKQVDLWGTPRLNKGDNIIYFAINEFELHQKLAPLFQKVWVEPKRRLFNKDADLPRLTRIYHAEGYKGGLIP